MAACTAAASWLTLLKELSLLQCLLCQTVAVVEEGEKQQTANEKFQDGQ